jgi:hypothetical protein
MAHLLVEKIKGILRTIQEAAEALCLACTSKRNVNQDVIMHTFRVQLSSIIVLEESLLPVLPSMILGLLLRLKLGYALCQHSSPYLGKWLLIRWAVYINRDLHQLHGSHWDQL